MTGHEGSRGRSLTDNQRGVVGVAQGLDLSKLPSGDGRWAEFVRQVGKVDDREERYFLELKSAVDLNAEAGRAKVAKFILGAANRFPEQAARRFDGHALMVLGVSK